MNEVAPFDRINPTAENISFEFARRIKLRTKIDTTVRVYESPTSWAEARAE
ncbi:MAG: 6-carboxytetrahydropterin synthase [Candidatus Aenigmarchaeota archaeon]|nr:6-carboxytetrahydropterin synthase [Candidatus Aenigmarchaeota archaeon]